MVMDWMSYFLFTNFVGNILHSFAWKELCLGKKFGLGVNYVHLLTLIWLFRRQFSLEVILTMKNWV